VFGCARQFLQFSCFNSPRQNIKVNFNFNISTGLLLLRFIFFKEFNTAPARLPLVLRERNRVFPLQAGKLRREAVFQARSSTIQRKNSVSLLPWENLEMRLLS
jgi:hypothetical protein